jgi:hypothetical protein
LEPLRVNDAEDHGALAEREALERVSRAEEENAMMFASACEDAEGLTRKVALLEDELAVEHRAWAMFEREHRACVEVLTLMQTWSFELSHAIIGTPWAKHLSKGMWLASFHHTEMVRELAAFQVAVSSATESVLSRSLDNTAHAVVVGELVAEF